MFSAFLAYSALNVVGLVVDVAARKWQ